MHDHPGLGPPPVREDGWMSVQHPPEVDATVDALGQLRNRRIVLETLGHRQKAAEEERRVDRPPLAPPLPLAGVEVEPVIEPAMLLEHARRERLERDTGAREDLPPRRPVPLRGNAHA